jgi:type 1 fimbriae regulatory protein FimB
LRVSEAVGLKLSDVDLEGRSVHVKRLKRGLSTMHPLRGEELRVLKAWLTERQHMKLDSKALFVSERRQPLNRKTAWVIIRALRENVWVVFGINRAGSCANAGFQGFGSG